MDVFHPPVNLENPHFLDRLRRVFAAMDRAFERAAVFYGFSCNGCEDNCCRSVFFHHTYLEYGFLRSGFGLLPPPIQAQVRTRVRHACGRQSEEDNPGGALHEMCPLNCDGLCILYAYRPMICRLHGLPHELRKPGQPVSYGPGCPTFDHKCANKTYLPFDRTSFYQEVAQIEQEFRLHLGTNQKIRMTVAEMIGTF
jgi:hypothetical protein